MNQLSCKCDAAGFFPIANRIFAASATNEACQDAFTSTETSFGFQFHLYTSENMFLSVSGANRYFQARDGTLFLIILGQTSWKAVCAATNATPARK